MQTLQNSFAVVYVYYICIFFILQAYLSIFPVTTSSPLSTHHLSVSRFVAPFPPAPVHSFRPLPHSLSLAHCHTLFLFLSFSFSFSLSLSRFRARALPSTTILSRTLSLALFFPLSPHTRTTSSTPTYLFVFTFISCAHMCLH